MIPFIVAMKLLSPPWFVASGVLLVASQACVFDYVEECEARLTCSGGAPAIPSNTTTTTGGLGATAGGGGASAGGDNVGGADADAVGGSGGN